MVFLANRRLFSPDQAVSHYFYATKLMIALEILIVRWGSDDPSAARDFTIPVDGRDFFFARSRAHFCGVNTTPISPNPAGLGDNIGEAVVLRGV